MELFIPSILALLAAIAVVFLVLPSFGTSALITGSIVMLGLAAYIHYTRFGVMEYERETWTNNLRQYTSYIILLLVLLGAYGFYAMTASSSSISSPSLPPVSMPTMGGGLQSMMKTATSRINELVKRGRISTD